MAVLRVPPAVDEVHLPGEVPARLESYEHLQEFLFRRTAQGIKLGLDNTLRMLDRLGHPEASLRALHIAGTNGKGSTSSILASVLKAAGFRTGLYTSPHLVDYRERFRIDGVRAAPLELIGACERILPHLHEIPLTFFEITTVMAFLVFLERAVDAAVIEVGLGGRLDATNVLSEPIPVITDIQFDHERVLGRRLREIASEKAGIIRGRRTVVTGARRRDVLDVLGARAAEMGAPIAVLKDEVWWKIRSMSWEGTRFDLRTRERVYPNLFLPLPGEHQVSNAALAVRAIEVFTREIGLDVGPGAVREGVATVVWPGRLQVVRHRPLVVLDAAHNPAGARALAKTLGTLGAGRRRVLVVGMLRDKKHGPVIRTLARQADEMIFTSPPTERSVPADLLRLAVGDLGVPHRAIGDVGSAVETAADLAGPDGMVCVTGSCYTVGEALRAENRQ